MSSCRRSTFASGRSRQASSAGSSSGSVRRALLDETSRAYRDAGLGYIRMDDAAIVDRLLADVRLLRLPLIRRGNEVTAGRAEATWTAGSARRARPDDRQTAEDDAGHDQARRR